MAIKVEKFVPLTSGTAPTTRRVVSAAGSDDVIKTETIMRDDRIMFDSLRMTDYGLDRPQ